MAATKRVRISDPHDVRITRPGEWGNPYKIGLHGSRAQVVAAHRRWIAKQPKLLAALPLIRGKRLGCVCGPRQQCHGDFLCVLADLLG